MVFFMISNNGLKTKNYHISDILISYYILNLEGSIHIATLDSSILVMFHM